MAEQGGDWVGFAGEMIGAMVAAAVAIGLWRQERKREHDKEDRKAAGDFRQAKEWLLMQLGIAKADFDAEQELVRQMLLSVESFADFAGQADRVAIDLPKVDGYLALKEHLEGFVAAGIESQNAMPSVEPAYVLMFGSEFCSAYSSVREQVRAHRRVKRMIGGELDGRENLVRLLSILRRLANAGRQTSTRFDEVLQLLGAKVYDAG